MQRFNTDPLKQLRNRIENAKEKNIVLGAGDVNYGERWIATNIEELDITDEENWEFLFRTNRADHIMAEHVWEHLTEEQADKANANVFNFLKPGGNFRIAIPDGLHPDPKYIEHVRPGGSGAGAADHKILYTFVTISRSLIKAGFKIELLEFWDGDRNFNYNAWSEHKGKIGRSLYYDERNNNGRETNYTSLIVDAIKPGGESVYHSKK